MTTPTRDQVLKDPASSYWLKQALVELEGRDPVDALHDAETLLELMKERLAAIVDTVS